MTRMPTYFISHGGGPWPWMPSWRDQFAPLEESLRDMPRQLPAKPKAILVVSGHWEQDSFAVMSAARPPMVYDYSGFPRETYDVVYPAPGAPDLANETAALISNAGLPTRLDPDIGFDHGTFVPLAIMYPDADVPLFQVSMNQNYDPESHVALGRALAPLRDQGVLIIGSGLSYHNLRLMNETARVPSEAFDVWLNATLDLPPEERTQVLQNWEQAPHARTCHAKEDHFVPIFAALGAAEDDPVTRIYHQTDVFGGVTASGFRFG
ncbi:class III extradiol ring-cleavage dioxygenase [Shimia thalassica]|uniref:DODA-type extradiol aromatic ring-opening family dioxygenase n=1 Tax=Shimia thalassica TaxID=1715693 RepID=UPI001C0902C6|nr:class III extradiol ring-cleavage dioxygenase [Shimia thalassica]MBU2943297.1 dioxygenase [Shimia thalassica]MDO6501366.1 class III extradiol ring-cleavage dioxygenase [Shimia thalassica]